MRQVTFVVHCSRRSLKRPRLTIPHLGVWLFAASTPRAALHHRPALPCLPPRRYVPWEAAKQAPTEELLIVDCTHPSALTVTHHKAARNPPGGASDCSTGLVLDLLALAGRDPSKAAPWLAQRRVSVNHFDADAVLSMWALIHRHAAPAHAAGGVGGCRRRALAGRHGRFPLTRPAIPGCWPLHSGALCLPAAAATCHNCKCCCGRCPQRTCMLSPSALPSRFPGAGCSAAPRRPHWRPAGGWAGRQPTGSRGAALGRCGQRGAGTWPRQGCGVLRSSTGCLPR